MLPKVASHFFNHTARAATTVQNYTLRNVIGFQAPSTSAGGLGGWNGAGSSSWGGHGAGPGGAKYNTGSRFYNGYTGAGRAVTQVNSATAHDSGSGANDDTEDFKPRRILRFTGPRSRPRSSSLSIGPQGRNDRGETLGVLKTVQLHQARARHAFSDASSTNDTLALSTGDAPSSDVPSSRPVLVRRNSTSVSSSQTPDLDLPPPPPPASPVPLSTGQLLSTDPAAPQTTLPPTPPPSEDDEDGPVVDRVAYERLLRAKESQDTNIVTAEVLNFRNTHACPGVAEYNMALQALHSARIPGHPINLILETYNEMIARQIVPNLRTYKILILALCDRDKEVHKVVAQLQWRMKRRRFVGRHEAAQHATDGQRAAQLREENNFASAMMLFQAAAHLRPAQSLGLPIYGHLLRSCAFAANIDAAIRVFAHLEGARQQHPDATCFFHLLSTYVNAGDLAGAQDVFDEFRAAAREGRLAFEEVRGPVRADFALGVLADDTRSGKARSAQMSVWNKLLEGFFRGAQPERAVALLEQMLNAPAGIAYGPADVPPPCAATYSACITGFLAAGDVTSALVWFDRMLAQSEPAPKHPLAPTLATPRPDQIAWNNLLESLAERQMRVELNKYFRILLTVAETDGLEVRAVDRVIVFETNFAYLETTPDLSAAEVDETVEFLLTDVLVFGEGSGAIALGLDGMREILERLLGFLARRQKYDLALALLEAHVAAEHKFLEASEQANDDADRFHMVKGIRNLVMSMTPNLLSRKAPSGASELTLDYALRFADLSESVGLTVITPVGAYYMHAYNLAKARGEPLQNLSAKHWSLLARAAGSIASPVQYGHETTKYPQPDGFQFQGLPTFVQDLKHYGVQPQNLPTRTLRRIIHTLWDLQGREAAEKLCAALGDEWLHAATQVGLAQEQHSKITELAPTPGKDAVQERPYPRHVDLYHGRYVDEYYPANPKVTPLMAWERYQSGIARRVYPPPEVIGRLINTFGRLGNRARVDQLYKDAQLVLAALGDEKKWQSVGWYTIEDQMIIALAHGGDLEAAHVHRQRIIEHGGTPSSDAYGALIQNVKETTDDNANALMLWQESQVRGVIPNIYLYNTIISKVSRARKAEFAIELFQQMKASHVRPSSVTYGAVIAACCRVGDAQSAELLFKEMTLQQNFKPRVPPYNTMIQLYTQTKPDRERVLFYFGELLTVGIQPSAHTYKLLLDCYGTIEPVDLPAMHGIFDRLVADPYVKVLGTHWASVINAWGCVQKDLDKAIEVFESVKTHPSTVESNSALPDAVTFEAIINVLVTHRRTDLIPSFLTQLVDSRVHMTAYIANLLIKGFAAANDMDSSRQIFESLADPPAGVAAPNNHAPHDTSKTPRDAPGSAVYREPSTWEAMIRAELGCGNRDRALILLDRLKARQYPLAVYMRISGIMHDATASTWIPADNTPTDGTPYNQFYTVSPDSSLPDSSLPDSSISDSSSPGGSSPDSTPQSAKSDGS